MLSGASPMSDSDAPQPPETSAREAFNTQALVEEEQGHQLR